MIWAMQNDIRVKAAPKEKALCPLCKEEVISKCGEIKIWHWSHKKDNDCDLFKEPETEWHLKWKSMFPKEFQEVTLQKNQGLEVHRADIKNKEGLIIEFQNSSIAREMIRKREEF